MSGGQEERRDPVEAEREDDSFGRLAGDTDDVQDEGVQREGGLETEGGSATGGGGGGSSTSGGRIGGS